MLKKLRLRIGNREEGFALIELLVVILIIGILAAIAIPTFFNQRQKAQDSSSKEMAHTAQVAAAAISTDNDGSYSTVSPTTLAAVDTSISTAAGSPAKPFASAASGTANSWTVTITSPTGNTFTIAKSTGGVLSYTCTVPATATDRGGCPGTGVAAGSWG